jgi:hypothetical protein
VAGGVCLGFVTLFVLMNAVGALITASCVWLNIEGELFDKLLLTGLVAGAVVGTIPSLMVFRRVLGGRHFTFYAGERQDQPFLELRQSNTFRFTTVYTVYDRHRVCLAVLRADHAHHCPVRERWFAYRPDGTPWVVAEERWPVQKRPSASHNIWRALFPGEERGVGGLPSRCTIFRPDRHSVVGELNRQPRHLSPGPPGRYLLDLSPDSEHYLDRRVALAVAVLLGTAASG